MYTYSTYGEFRCANFQFEGRDALIIFPPNPDPQGRWMMKMEYFGAFPELEYELVRRGWHLCYLKNINRLGTDADSDAKARFADLMAKDFGLENKFTCIGMSCGGLCSVNFAYRHPEYVSLLYLDAPVMNFYSWPMGFGVGFTEGKDPYASGGWAELVDAYGFDRQTFLTYRGHPMDKIPALAENNIPVALVYGDSDTEVPYIENGILLERYYKEHGLTLFCVGKAGCGHHPHGLEDNTELIAFIEENTKK